MTGKAPESRAEPAPPLPTAIRRLQRFLAERGYHPGGRDPGERDLPRDAALRGPDSARRMTRRPVRVEWGFSQFGNSWWINVRLLVSRNKGRSFGTHVWRAELDGLERVDGDKSLDAQADFVRKRLEEIERRVQEEGPESLIERLEAAGRRISHQWPRELHEFRLWLLGRGYRIVRETNPDAEFFGNELMSLEGPVLEFTFSKDRSFWSVVAAPAGLGSEGLQAPVWAAYLESRQPVWPDQATGRDPYVADASFFQRFHEEMVEAVTSPERTAAELARLSRGPWTNEPEWRRIFREHLR